MATATSKPFIVISLLAFNLILSTVGAPLALMPVLPAAAQSSTKQQAAILNNEGVTAINNKNYPLAMEKFEEALKIEPGYQYAIDNLSTAYNNYALNLPAQEALKYFHKAMAISPGNATTQQNLDVLIGNMGKNPNSFKDRADLAKQCRISGDFDGAIAEYISALRCKNDAKTHLELGNVYRVRDRVDDAINEYKAALAAGGLDRPSMAEVNKNLGESYQAKKDVKSAIAAFGDAIKFDPANRDIVEALIAGWEEAINENPKSADNHIGLGQAYQLKGDFGQAKAEYGQALIWDRNNQIARSLIDKLPEAQRVYQVDNHINRGVDLQSAKLYDQAITEYMEAIKLDGSKATVWVNLGSCLQEQEDYDRASKAYQRALQIQPNNDEAKKGLKYCADSVASKKLAELTQQAADLYKRGQYQDSLNAYREVCQSTPNDAGVHFNMGAAMQQLKDIDGAIAEYRKAVSLDPKNKDYSGTLETAMGIKAQPLIEKAVAAQKEKNYPAAIDLYQQALFLVPKRTELHYNLATAYYALQQFDKSRSEFQKALDQDRKAQILSLYFLATIDENYGKGYDAMDKYRKYLAESPGGASAKQAQERLSALTKNVNDTQKIKSEQELAQLKEAADAYQAAVTMQSGEHYDQAIDLYKRAMSLQPTESAYPYGLGTAYILKGDIDTGLGFLDKAIALDPKNNDYRKSRTMALERKAEHLVNQAVGKQQAEDFASAIQLYDQATKLAPTNARIWTDLGSAIYSTDDFAGALKAYRKALDLDPKAESVDWYSVAAMDEHFGHGGAALDEYRKFITYNPADKHVDAARERIAALQKNVNDTKQLPTRSEAKAQQSAAEAYDQGLKLYQAQQYDQALPLYQKAALLNPKEAVYQFAIGTIYQARKDLVDAAKYYNIALSLDPKNAQYKQYSEGVRDAEAGPMLDQAAQKFTAQDFPAAINLYRQAIEIVPNDPAVHTDLASALQANDDFADALKEYQKAYDIDPKSQDEVLYFIGALQENFGDAGKALKSYRNYAAKNPSGKYLDYARARMTALTRNAADIQKIPTRAEREQSAALDGIFKEAVSLQEAKRFDEADAKYNELMMRSKDSSYIYARGTNYQAKGDIPKAIQMYRQAAASDPKNKDYAKALAAALEGETALLLDDGIKKYNSKDFAGSVESMKQALDIAPRNAHLHTALGASYQALENFQAARDEYQKGFDLDSHGEADNLYFMGILDETFNHGKTALGDYTKYLQYAPKGPYAQQANARYQVLYFDPTKVQKLQTQQDVQAAQAAGADYDEAVKLQQDNKFDEAIAKYREALKVNDKNDSVWYGMGTAYQGKGDYDQALSAYATAEKLNPQEPNYKKVAADLKVVMAGPFVASAFAKQTGKNEKGEAVTIDLPGAIQDYLKALRLDEDANTHMNLGTAYQANKDNTNAILHYQKAVQLDPKLADPHYYLGTVYEALGEGKFAKPEYRKYLLLQPTGQYAGDIKERLKLLK